MTKPCAWPRRPSSASATARAPTTCSAARCSPPDATRKLLDVAETAVEASGEDYNVYVPIMNCLGAMGKEEAHRNMRQRRIAALENHFKQVPEDARARILLGSDYAYLGRSDDAIARTQPGRYLARQRSLDSLQRGLPVLQAEQKAGCPGCPA